MRERERENDSILLLLFFSLEILISARRMEEKGEFLYF
jgi:hypothetical protein